jgi:regulator of protease activity HflC (stomatin/prohibitin superfamily)
MNTEQAPTNRERDVNVLSGWSMTFVLVVLIVGSAALLIESIRMANRSGDQPAAWLFGAGILMVITASITARGFFTLQPNEARVLILFGAYKGSVRSSGFHWGNPFYSNAQRATNPSAGESGDGHAGSAARARSNGATPLTRQKISLRARTLNGDKLKVNDKRGNPVEIAAIVIWRVQDTAQAAFDVDDYEKYVATQSESALRHLASGYAYDNGEEHEITLRSGVEEVSQSLRKDLQERLAKAGLVVEEARLTHLAYAPEIAQAMLRRQQAEAVIAARQKLVHGAVSMVDMALKELDEKHVVHLDDERKAAMVSNLMVVLCGEAEVHPVVNAGTLYN